MCANDVTQIASINSDIFLSLAWSRQMMLDELQDDSKHYIVCTEGDRIIGYGGFSQILNEGHIMNIAVVNECRRLKIGSTILNMLLSKMRQLKIDSATLEVEEDNVNAIAMYKKAGFVEQGKRPNYYGKGRHCLILWVHI
jgi:ribosomal-protein-alanine acetyltransferase